MLHEWWQVEGRRHFVQPLHSDSGAAHCDYGATQPSHAQYFSAVWPFHELLMYVVSMRTSYALVPLVCNERGQLS